MTPSSRSLASHRLPALLLALALLLACACTAHLALAAPQAAPSKNNSSGTARDAFLVRGDALPGVTEVIGAIEDTYAGFVPVDGKEPERGMYFWYVPLAANATKGEDDLILWMNGGPGCSSLLGALRENGPFTVTPVDATTVTVTPSSTSWNGIAHVLYVETPIGTGNSVGEARIKNEDDFAEELLKWYEAWLGVFPEFKEKKVWVFGESYAANYAVYASDKFSSSGLSVGGFSIVSGVFLPSVWDDVWTVPYALEHAAQLDLSPDDAQSLSDAAEDGGFGKEYREATLTWPANGAPQLPDKFTDYGGAINSGVRYLPRKVRRGTNDCFNFYHITDKCPAKKDPFPINARTDAEAYSNWIEEHPDFKTAMHMPPSLKWRACTADQQGVFVDPDASSYTGDGSPSLTETPFFGSVLDKILTQGQGRVVISAGRLDVRVPYLETMLGLQNTTWGGKAGFEAAPVPGSLVVGGKTHGTLQSERGLTFAVADDAGHTVPIDQPELAYKLAQFALGHVGIEEISSQGQ